MSKRAAKFVSAIFASLLAGSALVTASHGAPAEADKCLSGPKGAPPAGGHWYYRIDRDTKRPCWYLGDAKEKVARATPEVSQPAASSVSAPNSASTQRSIANARAELPFPQTRVEPQSGALSGKRAPATAADATSPENDQRANAGDASAQRSVIASRWFEPTGITWSAPPQPSADGSASKPQPTSEAAPPPAAAAITLAAADASSARPSGSMQQVLIAIMGALALAGLIASAIFRLSGGRRTGRREVRVERRVNWHSGRTSRPSLSDDARGAVSMREIGLLPEGSLPRDSRAVVDPNERVSQMLARLARSAAS